MKLFLNCDDNPITYNKKNYLLRAAKRLGIDYVVDIKNRIDDEPTDYILNIEPCSFIKGNKWSGIWNIDLLINTPVGLQSDWAVADTVFTAISTYPREFDGFKSKVQLLFQACDPELHRPIPDISKHSDFLLCGSSGSGIYAERSKCIDVLKGRFSFIGYDNNKRPEEYIQTLNKARVQFIRSMKTDWCDGEIAQRFFECLAIGPVLTNYVPDLELTGLTEGIDYLSYMNDREMILKMKDLLEHPDKAAAIAKSGRQKALLMHTYEHRLVSILNTIKEFTNG